MNPSQLNQIAPKNDYIENETSPKPWFFSSLLGEQPFFMKGPLRGAISFTPRLQPGETKRES